MRILQITPRIPYPKDDGGKIGIANIYERFAREASVTLFSATREGATKRSLDEAGKFGEVIVCENSIKNNPFRIIRALSRKRSLPTSKFCAPKVFKDLARFIEGRGFDIVHADHTFLAPLAFFAAEKTGARIGIRLHNIEAMIWKRYADTIAPSPKRMFLRAQANKILREESEFISKADVNFAITEEEKIAALEMAPNAKVVVASAGIDPDSWSPDSSIKRDPSALILATTYKWRPNVDAVDWFAEKVMPAVKKRNPDARLTLLGKNPPDSLKYYRKIGVDPIGYVESIKPYLDRSSIYVAPLFAGAGIRIKILEAMAAELPVVATPISAEGISARDAEGLFVRRTAEEFVETVSGLIENPDDARTAGKAARKFVSEFFSWDKNVGIMLEEYGKFLG